jgi:transposase-like protein
MSIPNEELKKLLEHLNDDNKLVAKSFLTWLLEKQDNDEDDFLSFDDIRSIEQARRELDAGETTSLEDLKRELDL